VARMILRTIDCNFLTFSVTVSASISKIPIADAARRVINIRSKQPYDVYIGNLKDIFRKNTHRQNGVTHMPNL
jgi:hypothetical protein